MRFSIAFIAFLLCILVKDASGQQGREMHSVNDVYLRYPERFDSLFQSLNLEYAGLEAVSAAVARGALVKAGEELLKYYRNGTTGGNFRRKQPSTSSAINPEADSLLRDLFVFYDLPDRVPRLSNGSLDWTYQGPDNDIEWAWGLNRHGHLLTLLEAYFETGNPVYAERITI